MFLAYLMDEGDTSCMDSTFTIVFFVVGISHFIIGIVERMAEYAEQASEMDGVISPLEEKIMWSTWLLLHVIRVAQFPLVGALGFYSFKFAVLERSKWTHLRD